MDQLEIQVTKDISYLETFFESVSLWNDTNKKLTYQIQTSASFGINILKALKKHGLKILSITPMKPNVGSNMVNQSYVQVLFFRDLK